MQCLRSVGFGLAKAAIWPLYLVLLAYMARVAPWPRSLGVLISAVSTGAAIAIFIHDLLNWLTSPSGLLEQHFGLDKPLARQLNRGSRFVAVAAATLLVPVYLLDHELIVPEGKPITAPAIGRLLVLGFELLILAACVRILRRGSPFLSLLPLPQASDSEPRPNGSTIPGRSTSPVANFNSRSSFSVSAKAYSALVWLSSAAPPDGLGTGDDRRHHILGRSRIQFHRSQSSPGDV